MQKAVHGVSRQNSFMLNEDAEDICAKTNEENHQKDDDEEEDYENFFLQPATSPYDIKEKITAANRLLSEENVEVNKIATVRFREELVDFEPDSNLTDDDVQSIESYTEEVMDELKYVIQDQKLCDIIEDEEIIEESIIESIIEMNHKKSVEIEEEQMENIQEDIDDYDIPEEIQQQQTKQELEEDEEYEEVEVILPQPPDEELQLPLLDLQLDPPQNEPKRRKCRKRQKPPSQQPHAINCRKHCIEGLETHLEQLLHLREKPLAAIPTLRLHRQKCCSGGCKLPQKLPQYTGLHSEYGLSSAQILQRAKHKQSAETKAARERELVESYRQRKLQQNEAIFRQWLREVSERKEAKKAQGDEEKRRPQTANCVASLRRSRRRRPHTTSSSTARIFIEIPEGLLAEGLRLGDLLVQNQRGVGVNVTGRRLHMITFSANAQK